eukprot:scaffold21870_cov60-Phaeocystis_antarctica.AAC.4
MRGLPWLLLGWSGTGPRWLLTRCGAVKGLRLRVGAHAPRRHTCTSSEGRRQLYVPGGGACGESQRRGRRGGAACV